ncbi:hypothetical protein HMPREF1423_00243 [Helicobacter pylori GAM270ASi]|nr:hypothetical protein HMPREF1400_00744 [Helicobacter pylori GAM119Bi]EMH31259.1 hypothetical protein HMPREF1423_00243 [Helicobacter pylori GAM270ASi]
MLFLVLMRVFVFLKMFFKIHLIFKLKLRKYLVFNHNLDLDKKSM